MKKIVVAADSFKGSLSSEQAASAVAEAAAELFPRCELVRLAMADGGEGTAEALLRSLGGTRVEAEVHDPLMRPVRAAYGILPDGITAAIELSAANGLTLLSEDERNPMNATSFGCGELIADALRRGCSRVLAGLGGSATNDAGTGMLEALGARFLDADGQPLPGNGASLGRIASADLTGLLPWLASAEFIAACDVRNCLCGPDGAACVFAPQKGADAAMVDELDRGLRNFAEVTRKACGCDLLAAGGSGAAGGIGGAMLAYLHARMVPGAELLLDASGFDRLAAGADLVFTGEGCLDEQSLMGKVPVSVLRRASALGVPVVALAGKVRLDRNPGFAGIYEVTPPDCPPQTAMRSEVAYENVRRAALRALKDFSENAGRF